MGEEVVEQAARLVLPDGTEVQSPACTPQNLTLRTLRRWRSRIATKENFHSALLQYK